MAKREIKVKRLVAVPFSYHEKSSGESEVLYALRNPEDAKHYFATRILYEEKTDATK